MNVAMPLHHLSGGLRDSFKSHAEWRLNTRRARASVSPTTVYSRSAGASGSSTGTIRTLNARRLHPLICVLGLACAGCSDEFLARWSANFRQELATASEQQTCGDGHALAALVTDCPMQGVCFTEACRAHDLCYAFCERPRSECDLSLYTGMTGICYESFAIDDSNLRQCLYFALAYYGVVEAYGGAVYPCDGSPPPLSIGACCTAGENAACTEGEVSACSSPSISFPGQSCTDLNELFGGCPVPVNDDCETAMDVCLNQAPASGAGVCSGSSESEIGDRVCEIASQNCLAGETCLPHPGELYLCTAVGDNRLATTDGAILGAACGFDLPNRFQADIWFRYTPPCTGTLSLSMCRGTQYDATLAVYGAGDASCACTDKADAVPLACDDDACGSFQSGGLISIPAAEGACYLIRVGGWSSDFTETGAARGLSQLEIGMLCE